MAGSPEDPIVSSGVSEDWGVSFGAELLVLSFSSSCCSCISSSLLSISVTVPKSLVKPQVPAIERKF